jgi:hypothetical protein
MPKAFGADFSPRAQAVADAGAANCRFEKSNIAELKPLNACRYYPKSLFIFLAVSFFKIGEITLYFAFMIVVIIQKIKREKRRNDKKREEPDEL